MNNTLHERDYILPHNLLAEKAVLGTILSIPEAISIVDQKLPIEAFYIEKHQIIYKVLLILYAKGMTIDFILLTTWLQNNALLLEVGGLSYILDLKNQLITSSKLDEYIALIYEKYIRRSLIELGEEIIESGYSTNIPLEKIFSKIEHQFFLITEKEETKRLISVKEGLEHILKEMEESLKTTVVPGLSSSFLELDSITQGFHKSDLIIIAGRPSMGKTAFAFNLAKNIASSQNKAVLFFSLEMSHQQLLYRLLASEVLISSTRLRSARIKQTEWDKINKVVKNLSKLNLYIDDTPTTSVGEMKLKVRTLEYEHQISIDLIIIDYLQLLEEISKVDNRVQELSKITRSLKKLARDLNVPIIVLSQLSRTVETRMNKRPILSDLRESGCIAFDYEKIFKNQVSQKFRQNSFLTLTWNGKTVEPQRIEQIKLTGQKPIYRVETILGYIIYVTNSHQLLTEHGWKRIDEIKLNDVICIKMLIRRYFNTKKSNIARLTWDKIININYKTLSTVYDLEIQKFSNYWINNLLVHNSIEQDADVVIMLYRDEYYNKKSLEKDTIEIILAKHRNGPIGSTKLQFDPKYLRFSSKKS